MPDLNCTTNAAIAYNFLVGKGLTDVQAAAVVGNLQQESFPEMNPRLEVKEPKTGLPARGIAMWGPPRWAELEKFANGRDPKALETQLEFLWYELETQPSLGFASLRASTTIPEAVRVFQDKFEKPDSTQAATDQRITYANKAFNIYRLCPIVNPPPEPSPKKAGAIAAAIGVSVLFVAATIGAYKIFSRPEPEPLPRYEPIYRPRPRPIPPAFRRIP